MDISPQRVRTAEFRTVKRGLDPDEVREFLTDVAAELERAQNQSTAMEARARAAVARLQEISESGATAPIATSEPAKSPTPTASVDEAETISRTLLLAQRTADTAVAEAKAEAERIEREASAEAAKTIDSTREMSARLLDEARDEARRAGESERLSVKTEVDSLRARRDFLESDVDHLERHLADERSRLPRGSDDAHRAHRTRSRRARRGTPAAAVGVRRRHAHRHRHRPAARRPPRRRLRRIRRHR